MYLIYQIAKFLVWLSFRIYYPKSTVRHLERLKFDHPAIVVSNHPNTLLDVLHVAYRSRKQVFFLANASMFATRFGNWFFNHFYCIPIRRKKDNNTKINNKESFARCNEFLGSGGCLYIAPEGVSFMQRGLRPVKKGAARIAIGAEAQHHFNLGLKIVPVGLTYDAPNYFGSRLFVEVAEPIDISSFKDLYQENPSKAVNEINQLMANRLQASMINPQDETEDKLLHQIEEIDRNEQARDGVATYERSQLLLERLQEKRKQAPTNFQAWTQSIKAYFDSLKKLGINDQAVYEVKHRKSLLKNVLLLVLGLPFFLYGFLNNLLAITLPLVIVRKVNPYVGYNSTIKILAGLFLSFPLFYGLQTYVFHQYFGSTLWTLIYFISLVPMGLVAWHYYLLFKQSIRTGRFKTFNRKNPVTAKRLFEQRASIKAGLEI